jgi:hypothetical protein
MGVTPGVTRRTVLGLGLAAAGLSGIGAAAAAQASSCFLGQSGEPQAGRVLLGLLITDDEAALRALVGALRERHAYRRVLRSRSTDRFRTAFAGALIDALAALSGTRFEIVALDLPPWPKPGPSRDRLVGAVLAEALSALPAGVPATLADTGAGLGTLARAAGFASPGRELRYARIGDDDLLQVAAFMTGLANAGDTRAPSAKSGLVARLGRALGVADVSARSLPRHPRYAVRSVRM